MHISASAQLALQAIHIESTALEAIQKAIETEKAPLLDELEARRKEINALQDDMKNMQLRFTADIKAMAARQAQPAPAPIPEPQAPTPDASPTAPPA